MAELANPVSTGGSGPAFETLVGAGFLASLLVQGAPLALGSGTLKMVHLQGAHLGFETDDYVLEAVMSNGQSNKAIVQAKRTFTLRTSDQESVQVLIRALADFRRPAFNQAQDVIVLVISSLSAKIARGLRTLLDCSRASLSSDDMVRRLNLPAYLGAEASKCYQAIVSTLQTNCNPSPDADEVWRFLRHFHVLTLDLDVPHGMTETLIRSLLTASTPNRDSEAAESTWNELIIAALRNAGAATSFRREDLPKTTLERQNRPTGFSTGIARLQEDTKIVAELVRDTVADTVKLSRSELVSEICQAVEENQITLVIGEAGSGKSAVAKAAFETGSVGSLGFAFRAESLAAPHINEILQGYDLTLEGLRAQTVLQGRKLVWIESIERLLEKPSEQRVAFLDFLRGLRHDPNWRFLITCRSYSADTVKNALFGEVAVRHHEVQVSSLSDEELAEVSSRLPALKRPLGNAPLRELLRRPFYLDKAARMTWPDSEPLPANEREFRIKVWNEVIRKNHEGQAEGMPSRRGKTMMAIALRRAQAMEPFVGPGAEDPGILHRLSHDSLLNKPTSATDLFAPGHDVIEDWALMQWLDELYIQGGNRIDFLFSHIGTYPALRRAYRKWLTEILEASSVVADPQVLEIVKNDALPAHWRDDTFVGILLSSGAYAFLLRNASEMLSDVQKLLWQAIHLLRVACQSAIPKSAWGLEGEGYVFFPRGNGWFAVAELLESAIPHLSNERFPLILEFLERWRLFARVGVQYPRSVQSIVRVGLHFLPYAEGYGCPVQDSDKRVLALILTFPHMAVVEITTMATAALSQPRHDRDGIESLIFNYFYGEAIFRDLPDIGYQLVEYSLDLHRSLAQMLPHRLEYEGQRVDAAFGLSGRVMEDFPCSALHGPYLHMLQHDPSRGLAFIIRFINRCCEIYSHPNNPAKLEPVESATFKLPDGSQHQQNGNGRLWGAYRGFTVAPDAFSTALMALEQWLLQKAHRKDEDVETVLSQILTQSNNVALTAVVASVVTAHPMIAAEVAFSLLSGRFFLQVDFSRSHQERSNQNLGFGAFDRDVETAQYNKERSASGQLPHRGHSLEHLATTLQMGRMRDRVHAIIDEHLAALPPEAEQDYDTKIWRLQLHRIDLRKLQPVGQTEDGRTILQTSAPAADLQVLIEDQVPKTAFLNAVSALFVWGEGIFNRTGKATNDPTLWRDRIKEVKALVANHDQNEEEMMLKLMYAAEAYIAAACIRDHWDEMSIEEKEWAAIAVFNSIEDDADETEFLSIRAHNSFEASRPAAFIVFALWGKELPEPIRERLLPAMSCAVIHAVEETSACAFRGVSTYLWASDRALSLTCLNAAYCVMAEEHQFQENLRSVLFAQRGETMFDMASSRDRARELILSKALITDETILQIDLTAFPGRSMANMLLQICTEHPHDPLSNAVVGKLIAILPDQWRREAANGRQRGYGYEQEAFNSEMEHLCVKTICRFVLELEASEAILLCQPILAVVADYPEKAANLVKWLILMQGDRPDATTLWLLWDQFARLLKGSALVNTLDSQRSKSAELVHELFLGPNWKDQRDWVPMHQNIHRLVNLFEDLPPSRSTLSTYAYFLAHAGSPALPGALIGVAEKIATTGANPDLLDDNAVFYFEQILSRLISGGNSRIRSDAQLRTATLALLDAMVARGSSMAYKLRDDFLTPIPPASQG